MYVSYHHSACLMKHVGLTVKLLIVFDENHNLLTQRNQTSCRLHRNNRHLTHTTFKESASGFDKRVQSVLPLANAFINVFVVHLPPLLQQLIDVYDCLVDSYLIQQNSSQVNLPAIFQSLQNQTVLASSLNNNFNLDRLKRSGRRKDGSTLGLIV